MSTPPFILLPVSEFISDTILLTAEQSGAYFLLLMEMHQTGGRLPNDSAMLARIARISLRRWNLVSPDVLALFEVDGDEIKHTRWNRLYGRKPIPRDLKSLVFASHGFQCAYCGDAGGPFHIDHIHPVVLGGTNAPENLTVACQPCNLSKGAKTLDEWRPS